MRPEPRPVCYGEQAALASQQAGELRRRVAELEKRLAGVACMFVLGTLTNKVANEAIDFAHGV